LPDVEVILLMTLTIFKVGRQKERQREFLKFV